MRNFEQYGSGAIVFSHQKIRLENDKKKLEKEYLILELQILKEELRDSYGKIFIGSARIHIGIYIYNFHEIKKIGPPILGQVLLLPMIY